MGLLDWVYTLLYYFGFWRKSATVVFLGAHDGRRTGHYLRLADTDPVLGLVHTIAPTLPHRA